MKKLINPIFLLLLSVIVAGCDKGGGETPAPTAVSISNLTYTPTNLTIIPYHNTIIINGSIDYKNAQNGVASIRLLTSAGVDLTIDVAGASPSSGTLIGNFEIAMPTIPGGYSFQIWIIDGKGNNSNKLTGTLQANINDAAQAWVTMSQQYALHDVIWKNGMFIGVGDNGTIVTSTNGAQWTSRASGTNSTLHSVCWIGNKYIAVGNNSTILSSSDGINWAYRYLIDPNVVLYGVASSTNEVIAVGWNMATNSTQIMVSTDGVLWTANESYKIQGAELTSIAVSGTNGLYAAVGKKNGYPLILLSMDGIEWHDWSPMQVTQASPADIVYSGNRWVLTGYGVTGYSNSGSNWTMNYNPGFSAPGVTWSTNKFVAVALDGIYTSPDGVTWTKSADIPYSLKSITWSGTQYIVVGFSSPVIMSSP